MNENGVPRAADTLTDAVVKKYGVPGIVVAAAGGVIFAALVWGAAHFTAAPGTPVSILWGFVQYTKEGALRGIEAPPPSAIEAPLAKSAARTAQPPPPVSEALQRATTPVLPRVIYPKAGQNHEAAIASLVKEYGLRDLEPLESGRAISETPRSTKFYVSAAFVAEYLATPRDWSRIKVAPATTPRSDFLAFLLQSGTFLLVAYCSESDAARLSSTAIDRSATFTVSPEPWTQMKVLILLPSDRIAKLDYRALNAGPAAPYAVLDIRLK